MEDESGTAIGIATAAVLDPHIAERASGATAPTQENETAEQAALKLEKTAIKVRRERAGQGTGDERTFALALSGGGMRSATFCLGLLRRLAKNRTLGKFDYLSTVSGGGFIGGALGRLYNKENKVEENLGKSHTLFVWWLRSNGRYLTPSGVVDKWLVFSTLLRGFLETQIEVLILLALAAFIIIAPHVLVTAIPTHIAASLIHLPSVWWWACMAPLFFVIACASAYWFCSDDKSARARHSAKGLIAVFLVLLGFCFLAYDPEDSYNHGLDINAAVTLLAIVIQAAIITGYVFEKFLEKAYEEKWQSMDGLPPSQRRMKYSRMLSRALVWFLVFAILGGYDFLSWLLVIQFYDYHSATFGSLVLLIAVIVGAVRATGPKFKAYLHEKGFHPSKILKVLNVIGFMLIGILLLLVCTVLSGSVFFWYAPSVLPFMEAGSYQQYAPSIKWFAGFVVLAVWIYFTRCNVEQLNLSSLHFLYRARISRSYVSVGNVGDSRVHRFSESPLEDANATNTQNVIKVTDTSPEDDVFLGEYKPHEYGGPIHLINCCINQTIDDRTGGYNADRKGIALTVSSFGIETGTRFPQKSEQLEKTSLSQWLAISGAAIGTGMGQITSMGVSALIFLSGLRIGYWSDNLLHKKEEKDGAALPPERTADKAEKGAMSRINVIVINAVKRYFPKYVSVFDEMLASFPGLRDTRWYVSDGGFFDNTGVYALLKRKVDFIVLADCGRDPDYLFSNIENLIRKALIDYAAVIEFMDPAHMPIDDAFFMSGADHKKKKEFKACFGTPDSINPSTEDCEYLLCARITYLNEGARDQAAIGTLLIVKPRRIKVLPLDIMAYSDREHDFPQQTTANQFFSEEQWESYHQLGYHFGEHLTTENFDFLERWVRDEHAIVVNPHKISEAEKSNGGEAEAITPRRQRVLQAIGATVGLGISVTFLISLWQNYVQYRDKAIAGEQAFQANFEKAMTILGDKDGRINESHLALNIAQFLAHAQHSDAELTKIQALFESLENYCKGKKTNLCLGQAYKRYLVRTRPDAIAPLCYWGGANSLFFASSIRPNTLGCRFGRYAAVTPVAGSLKSNPPQHGKSPCKPKYGIKPQLSISTKSISSAQAHALSAAMQDLFVDVRFRDIDTSNPLHPLFSTPWDSHAVLYSEDDLKDCAEAIGKAYQSHVSTPKHKNVKEGIVTKLPIGITHEKGIVELWAP